MVSVATSRTGSTTSEENLSFTVLLLSGTTQVFQGFSYDDRTSKLKACVLSWISGIQGIDEAFLKITLRTGERVLDIHQTFRDNEVTDGMEITAMVSRVCWGWRFQTAFQRHFPVCYSCMRMATDAHLAGKGHRERTRSIQQRIDFPGRERFCVDGVQFRELGTDGSPGALITTQWLHADHPLQ